MSHTLSFIKGELHSSPGLVCGPISVLNDTPDIVSLRNPLTQLVIVLQKGEQKVELPVAPFFFYSTPTHQGKIKCEQEGLSLFLLELPIPLYGVTSICGIQGRDLVNIATQGGLIYSLELSKVKETFAEIYQLSSFLVPLDPNYDERGLLDLVIGTDGRKFLYMCMPPQDPNTTDHINSVYELGTDGNTILITSFPAKNKIHNGGRLLLALPYLFVGTGDGGPQEDPESNAQNPMLLQGKILRFNVSTPGAPRPQESNPFSMDDAAVATGKAQKGRPEIYAYGIRNCWGLSIDSQSRVFCADVGHKTMERVNIIEKGGNYGWNWWEGTVPTPWRKEATRPGQQLPIIEYSHAKAPNPESCAIIGGYPVIDGVGRSGYVFADISGAIFFYYEGKDSSWVNAWICDVPPIPGQTKPPNVRVMGRDGLGQIYVVAAESLSPKARSYIYRLQGI